jgi:DNA-binding response OmpR family regulator
VDSPTKILFIEDDERLAQLTTRYLEGSGFLVTRARSMPEGLAAAADRQFDAILLDIMLPGGDGVSLCRTLRTRLDVPILMLTAKTEEADRVLGLDAGADDYVLKPFSSRELVARIEAHVRRARGRVGPALGPLEVGSLRIEPMTMRVTLDGRPVALTACEFAILKVLAERSGRVLSREQLLDLARGSAELAFERSIDLHISKLRQKLGDDARTPRYLRTVRGAGYVLCRDGEP